MAQSLPIQSSLNSQSRGGYTMSVGRGASSFSVDEGSTKYVGIDRVPMETVY